MNFLTAAWSMVITASFILAVQHFIIWINNRELTANLIFSIAAIGAAFSALFELFQLQTTSIEIYQQVVRFGHIPVFILLVSLIWFVDIYFGTARRWLTIFISTLWTLALTINFTSENNLTFRSISEIKRIALHWSEEFLISIGTTNDRKYLVSMATSNSD